MTGTMVSRLCDVLLYSHRRLSTLVSAYVDIVIILIVYFFATEHSIILN